MFIATLLIDIQICKHPKGPSAVNAQKVGQAPEGTVFWDKQKWTLKPQKIWRKLSRHTWSDNICKFLPIIFMGFNESWLLYIKKFIYFCVWAFCLHKCQVHHRSVWYYGNQKGASDSSVIEVTDESIGTEYWKLNPGALKSNPCC